MFKKFLMLMLVTSGSAYALDFNALDLSVGGGVLFNTADVDVEGADIDANSKVSLQVGGLAKTEITSGLKFRTGLFYTRKNTELEAKAFGETFTTDLSFDYLSVPLTVEYLIASAGIGIIGGVNFQLNIASDCEASSGSCDIDEDDVESTVTPLVLGVSKMFNEQWSGEATYEHALGETTEDLEISSFVFNVLYKI